MNSNTRPYLAIPAHLKQLSYQEPSDRHHTPFNLGWETEKEYFEWMGGRPDISEYFNQYMVGQHKWTKQFFDIYPLHELAEGLRPDQVFFVDVGGGFGQQSLAVKNSFPDTKVVLEELPFQIAKFGDLGDGVDVVAQDAWEEQSIKGKFHPTDPRRLTVNRASIAMLILFCRCSRLLFEAHFS